MAVAHIDSGDIQGDILRAHGNAYRHTSYLFLRVDDPGSGRAWLGTLVDAVATAAFRPGGKPPTVLNIAVTYAGLAALGVPPEVTATFSEEFRGGMATRATLLGDVGASAPSAWDRPLGDGSAHVLLTVNALTGQDLADRLNDLRADLAAAGGLAIVYEVHAQLLEGVREHFGYADGFAQPAVEGATDRNATERKARGGGVPEPQGKWRALAAGEFILGYGDEETRNDPQRRLPSAPAEPLGRNGTYMVWRKLYQDVALFRRTLRDAALRYQGGDENRLAAKIVGRWRNGTPLEMSPEAEKVGYRATEPEANNFRYAEDSDGFRCPLGAHIRRANPRDTLDPEARLSFRHRMIRRGMPYGPPLAPDVTEDDGEERGLVFACFNASISRQFESVQIQWLNDGNIFHLGHDKDFLLGDATGTGKMTVQGRNPFFLGPQASFVTTRGGEYLYVPGITALAAIADGVTG